MDMLLNWLGTLPGAASQGLIWGVMAIGLYITFKILDVADLTVDGSICTGAAVCVVLVTKGANIWLAMAMAFVAGALSGLVTGLMHTFLGIPVILSGILTQLMLWSVNLLVLGGSTVALTRLKYGDKVLFTSDSSAKNLQIYVTLGILLAIAAVLVAVLYWFFGTEIGISLRSTGNNPEMSRAQGINTGFTKVFGLALSNAIVAFSGALLAQQQAGANINMGKGAIVIGLAAIIVGEALCTKATANFAVRLVFVIVGAIIYWFVYQTVIFIGLPNELLRMLSAFVVAVFLGVPYLKKQYFSGKKGGKKHAGN